MSESVAHRGADSRMLATSTGAGQAETYNNEEAILAGKPGVHDFDFLMGRWAVKGRRLKERLVGCDEWIEFDASLTAWPLLDGYANGDAFRADWGDGLVGTTLRLFDPKTGLWSIWWAGKNNPVLDAPVVGRFEGDRGVFEAEDVFDGRPILVRFIWTRGTTPRWEQAFSEDGGTTWETNWIMDYTRIADNEGVPAGSVTRPARKRAWVTDT